MLNKLERKIGKYAIPHLINYLLMGYVIGYVFQLFASLKGVDVLSFMTLEPYFIIHKLQLWRIVSWILIPPAMSGNFLGIVFALIMIYFYYQLGNALEQTWGSFKFNLYIFGGLIFTILGAFITYAIFGPTVSIGSQISTSYLNMSIFLAFALAYPDMTVMLYFLIPVKMKWMAIVYAVLVGFEALTCFVGIAQGETKLWASLICLVASLLNFLIFFVMTKNMKNGSVADRKRRRQFQQGYSRGASTNRSVFGKNEAHYKARENSSSAGANRVNMMRSKNQPIARHKCAICGRTDITNPNMDFRFCSKCNGNFEYCPDHLFTHKHKL